MRRQDREILDAGEIRNVIEACRYIRIGFYVDGEVYIVPMNFGAVGENGTYVFYMHGAKEGRKIDLARKNPKVGFEMDAKSEIGSAETACQFTAFFESVIGTGTISIVEEPEEKLLGLRAVMKQATGSADWNFSEHAVDAVCVLKLCVEKLSCKVHQK